MLSIEQFRIQNISQSTASDFSKQPFVFYEAYNQFVKVLLIKLLHYNYVS